MLPHRPPTWVSKYIRIPFKDRGRSMDGADCWGGVRLVYLHELSISLPSHVEAYRGVDDGNGVTAVFNAERANWGSVAGPERVGDVGWFRLPGGRLHVGVAVAQGLMFHITEGAGAAVEPYDGPVWAPRLQGWFRYNAVHATTKANPMAAPVSLTIPAGGTLSEMLAGSGMADSPALRAFVCGSEVSREYWHALRPKPGTVVQFAVVPEGGAGGKTALRVVLTLAIIVSAIYAGPALAVGLGYTATGSAAAIATAGITVAGTLLVSALVPVVGPRLSDSGSGFTQSPSLSGARNQANPWGPIPVPLGEFQFAPPYAALPYTEVVGDDQYIRCIFGWMGPTEISNIQIGATPITDYDGVEIEVRNGNPDDEPTRLYPGIVFEEAMSVLLTEVGSWTVRTTQAETTEISIDVTFPQGVAEIEDDGSKSTRTVGLEVEYSVHGAGVWVGVNATSPGDSRSLDFLFRTPEATFGGTGTHNARIAWGSGFPDAKPGYLPTSDYAWKVDAWLHADTTGDYHFGVDGSDAIDLWIDGRKVVEWLGQHDPVGAPDFTAHNATVHLLAGWHPLTFRMESRSSNHGAAALGWKKPGDVAYSIVPVDHLYRAAGVFTNSMVYSWFETGSYTSSFSVTEARTETIRKNLAWAVPSGQYDVRVRRVTVDSVGDRIIDQVFLTAVRSIRGDDPVKMTGMSKIAIRIKATDQLNGVLDTLNCKVRSVLPDWTGTEWVVRGTSSPAACYRAVLQGSANLRPVGDDRLHLARLQYWSERTASLGLFFNSVVDTEGTVFERLRDVAAAGRAAFSMSDSLFSVVIDEPKTTPVQMFTSSNSSGFSGTKIFVNRPHGIIVRYARASSNYTQKERIVLDDGYSIDYQDGNGPVDAFGVSAPTLPEATRFETLEMLGITSDDEAFKHGRYTIACAKLRPEVYEIDVGVENLVATRGDLVLLQSDVPLLGICSGRIVRLLMNTDGTLGGVVVDETCPMAVGATYALRFRLSDATFVLKDVVTVPGEQTTLHLAAAIAVGQPMPEVGDLFSFGESGRETREVIVRSIAGSRDLSAHLTLVDHAPGVHTAEDGPIPPFDPGINIPPDYLSGPEAPVIESMQSDDFVMRREADGSLSPRILITFVRQSSQREQGTYVQVRTRVVPPVGDPEGPFTARPTVLLEHDHVYVDGVEEGLTYQIRVRYVANSGRVSPWTAAETTVIGKTRPPPDVVSFDCQRLSDGTRRFSWDLGVFPPDVAGVRIRYGPGGTGAWDDLSPLHDGNLEGSSPQDLNVPPEGYWRFGLKMVDTSDNLSVNAVFIDRVLGPARMEGVAVSEDGRGLNWPGTKTGCFVSQDGVLEARSTDTWDTLPVTWAAWVRWNVHPVTPIVYMHPTIDAGFVFHAEPTAFVECSGDGFAEVRWSLDNITFSAWTDVSTLAGITVQGRYFDFRLTVTASVSGPVPSVSQFGMHLRAKDVFQSIADLDTASVPATRRFGVGDVRLPIVAGQFAVVRGVELSFNGSGAGWTWEVVDRDLVLGPRVRLWNPEHVPADTVIDAQIRGLG